MALTLNTEQKQILSQKMIQSANILQMTATQLEQYLNDLSMENPVLDLVQKQPEEFNDKELEKYQWLRSHDDQNRYLYRTIEHSNDDSQDWNINQEYPESLHEHLWNQLLTKQIAKEEENAYHFLLDSLDSKGYFTDPLSEFALRFGLTEERASHMLRTIQQLTPSGVGARNLEECLCIQLDSKGQLTNELKSFIMNHLEDMAKNHLPAIAQSMKLPLETIKKYCSIVRDLNPKPGIIFSDSRDTSYIVPDVIIVKFKGHFDILLNESLYPDITLNGNYVRMYKEHDNDEVKNYLIDKIHQAEWIKQCIAQRNTTLLRVVQTILLKQELFFHHGPSSIKSLRLHDVAKVLDIHESTVSRAIRGKYLQCSWGIFPLNYFFQKAAPDKQSSSTTQGTPSSGTTVSDVKAALKEIIQGENKKKPYSDQILSELLSAKGFPISRRTVAKYRDEEEIPSMSGRKEY